MKHTVKITLILISMFLITQLIGIAVIHSYSPKTAEILINNQSSNITLYDLPYGLEPPKDVAPESNLISIIISIAFALTLLILLMKFKAELFLRGWFFLVITIAIAITFNSIIKNYLIYSSTIALIIALPLAYFKVFKRNIIVHNLTELIIYPGIAVIFIPLLSILTSVILLILISIYDIYAVWHTGMMQKMAKYQIQKVRVFSGFLIPYISKKDRGMIKSKGSKAKKVKVNVAILGGGDVIFPIILAGVVFNVFGILSAIIISLGATAALAFLFFMSEKGRFYPAMPFISAGCLLALSVVYFIH